MKGRAFYKDVSVSELMTLREQGLTNQQIANRLGVSYITIRRAIGPQPDGLKAKPRRKTEPLPPVGNTPLPDMPHESFAERCEAARTRAEKNFAEAIKEKPVFKTLKEAAADIPAGEPKEADKAREAHCKLIEENHSTPYTTYKEEPSPIPELIAMFGPDAVTSWLKVSLYNMGIPDYRPMNRQKTLEMLKIMNAGGANT